MIPTVVLALTTSLKSYAIVAGCIIGGLQLLTELTYEGNSYAWFPNL